jgi:hypothetical protein
MTIIIIIISSSSNTSSRVGRKGAASAFQPPGRTVFGLEIIDAAQRAAEDDLATNEAGLAR